MRYFQAVPLQKRPVNPEVLNVWSAVMAVRDIVMAAKILIVEDNSRLAESMAVCLNEAGYETSWAKNSAQGIKKALHERPDLIITDLHLPDMVAIEAIKILNNDSTRSCIPIVVLTAENGR